ncbi:hypothetical protein [Nocardioides sp. AX2bis]|uniref:hypothetical protein n=1 Tax=Nocardioides sp. AX2bis TaxID=2653157 RepID=UPI0012EFF1AA|nr:hypothetical protein [Nocardioides sp. AX2bis]VXB31709.1 conserved exported hypothetical protein [Nocardioides sp. AX2bis]
MSAMLKVLITLAVLLPVGGFVAGSLAANDTSGSPRETIVISESADRGAGPETTTVTGTEVRPGQRFVPEPAPTPRPTPVPPVVEEDDDDDDGPEPVIPQPVDVDDDDDDDDDDGGDDDDD